MSGTRTRERRTVAVRTDDGALLHPALDEQLAVHRRVSARLQA